MRRSSRIPTQWGWMRMIIFALLLPRLLRADERYQNEAERIRLDSIIPEDHQFRLPQVDERSQGKFERTGLDSIIPGNHKWSWDWIMSEIKRGLPSFSDAKNIVYSDELSDEEFFVQVRKRAAPAFEKLLMRFKQISDLSFSSSAPNFYNRIEAVDQVIFAFLFRTLELHQENLLEERLKSEMIQVLDELNGQFYLPQLTEEENVRNFRQDLKAILYEYMDAFKIELAIRNDFESPLRTNVDERVETVSDLSWRDLAAGYLNQPYTIATTITGLILSFSWWKNHHEKTQRQQAAQTLTDAIMAQLPSEDWQASYSLDDTGVQISYQRDLPDYLTLQIAGDEYSVTREEFQQYLDDYFSTIQIEGHSCKVERIEAEESGNPVIFIRLPHLTRAQECAIKERLEHARNDFLQQVKKDAPETQIPKLLKIYKESSNRNNVFDAKTGMDLLGADLTFTSDEYQNGIGKIIAFLENDVLGSVSSIDIVNQLQKLRYDSFKELGVTEKLNALLWLYSQLNTIVQLIIDPHSSVSLAPIAAREYVRLYWPFIGICQKLSEKEKLNPEALESFVMSMQKFISQVDLTGEFTSGSIVKGVREQMEKFLNEKNRERKEHIKARTKITIFDLNEFTPAERYQQLSALISAIKLVNEPIGVLPATVTNLIFFIRDLSGIYAGQLISEMPKLSRKNNERLKDAINRSINSSESLPVAAQPKISQSETIEYWSGKIENMPVTIETPSRCWQMNVGLFYCLTRVLVISQAQCSKEENPERYSFLENLRFLLAHFGYAMPFETPTLREQFSDFQSKFFNSTGESLWANIESSKLYKTLQFHSEQRERKIDGEKETEKMLEVVRRLQETLRSCSQSRDLFIPGMIIICGQIIPDLKRMSLLETFTVKVGEPLVGQLGLCVSTRNRLMHNPSSISERWIEPMAAELEPRKSREAVNLRRR